MQLDFDCAKLLAFVRLVICNSTHRSRLLESLPAQSYKCNSLIKLDKYNDRANKTLFN